MKRNSLSQKNKESLWGEDGPYSEVKMSVQTRILDDEISIVFLEVETYINPYTFELVKKFRELFRDDQIIQDLLDHSEFRGIEYGYVACAYSEEFKPEKLEIANIHLKYAEDTIIKMHKFVLKILNKKDFVN